jgi:hypothetical protein
MLDMAREAVGKARNAAEAAASLTFLERLSSGIYQ